MTTIKFDNVGKIYEDGYHAVENFNLEIQDNEFIVFVGPSGCGKSTTLRMLAGLEDISEGTIAIDDQVVNNVTPKNRDIAMVFQNYALYPHMTVYENMAFGLKLKKTPKAEIDRRVKEAAELLGITDLLKKKPKAMSGGQRQRVALGRAIVRQPKVFLMDEPLSNLDAKLRVQMRSEISKLQQRLGVTTVYVTHDQTEAMTMASRIVIMKKGVIQQIGAPKEVYDFPKNVFVGGFIGSPAMNFINGSYNDGTVTMNGFNLLVTESVQRKLAAYNGQNIIVGIRPEDIHDEPMFLNASPQSVIEAEIEVVELLGAESILFTNFAGSELIAKLDSRFDYQVGDKVQLAFDVNKLHFFDAQTEERI
ncbi:ABC transporter ATP-binding protein [Macrococcus lamae]|uniref:sn-glycerol-3-phosphate ABC transporter ATP-binding protein UgpC n=1 Tax=Macrococcus lamae TaxID=198484 RepID=A0A4R6BSA6_9STAP|nr:sn-glycerol-3-phosphate ABC transporter ATP-binding protein UgpC [Macrococcus lamae]TDM05237.1 sn-glycerol-3-phosphate ABC transporter ATP-binding protein UgpC [Macrococcus lamae]